MTWFIVVYNKYVGKEGRREGDEGEKEERKCTYVNWLVQLLQSIIFETLCYIIYLVRNLILYICNVLSHKTLRSELR